RPRNTNSSNTGAKTTVPSRLTPATTGLPHASSSSNHSVQWAEMFVASLSSPSARSVAVPAPTSSAVVQISARRPPGAGSQPRPRASPTPAGANRRRRARAGRRQDRLASGRVAGAVGETQQEPIAEPAGLDHPRGGRAQPRELAVERRVEIRRRQHVGPGDVAAGAPAIDRLQHLVDASALAVQP